VLFVKVKSFMRTLSWQSTVTAVKYDAWMTARQRGMVSHQDFSTNE
jgi:hypothetical protein